MFYVSIYCRWTITLFSVSMLVTNLLSPQTTALFNAEMGKWVNANHMETPETSQSGSTPHSSGRDLFFRLLLVSMLFTFIMPND